MIQKIKASLCLFLFIGAITAQDDQIFIRNLILEGNENVSRNEILFIVRQRPPNFFFRRPDFDPRLLRLDALTLKNYYYSKGFLDVTIKESYTIEDINNENKYADILYEINEGKQYHISRIDIIGNDLITPIKIIKLLGLKENDSYNPVGLNDNLYY